MPPVPVSEGTVHYRTKKSNPYVTTLIVEGGKGNVAGIKLIGADGVPVPIELIARTLSSLVTLAVRELTVPEVEVRPVTTEVHVPVKFS